jgi:hypothetical protein
VSLLQGRQCVAGAWRRFEQLLACRMHQS